MNKNKKDHASDRRYTLFSEVGTGVSANTMLLLFHILTFFLQHRPKPLDLTVGLLALIHLVMLLIMGFLITDIFCPWGFWNDVMYKSVFYLYRILQGLSLCTTCLLSVLQAITLSPRSSYLAKIKHTPSHHNHGGFLFLSIFNLSVSTHFLISSVATTNHTSNSLMFVTKSCSLWPLSYFPRYTFFILWILRDVSLTGLMAISSGHMVSLLCRHKRRSQHVHSTSLSPRASPEHRATCTILLLMSVFVLLYLLDCIVSHSQGCWKSYPVRLCVQLLVGNGYTMIGPFVLISGEKQIIKFFKSMGEKSKCLIVH
nr:LOW QUALITY PROTEIN: vomeronasal type-1 receptor 90-like [Oryctolagus cuniculus]